MNDRRRFLARAIAAGTLPLVGPAASAATSPASSNIDQRLRALMTEKLSSVLGDPTTAATEVDHLLDIGFHWMPPTRPITQIKTIVAYGFGNRPAKSNPATTLPEPGPVNEELAGTVLTLYQQTHATIFAQWEIAHFLTTKHHLPNVIAIHPITAADGTITYLSTDGVAQAVLQHAGGNATALSTVGVIAHRDHAKRCVQTSIARGMDACIASSISLPVTYDPQSGQPWTRRRDLYLIHDMGAQFMQLRAQIIARDYPNG